jgi:hypothetical protein
VESSARTTKLTNNHSTSDNVIVVGVTETVSHLVQPIAGLAWNVATVVDRPLVRTEGLATLKKSTTNK